MRKNNLSFISYIWTVIVNIFTVFVILAIFNSIYENFEKIIVSIAVLIYIQLVSFASGMGLVKQMELLSTAEEFKKIRQLLKDGSDESSYEEEEIENSKNILKKHQIKFYINAIFIFIIYLIALFNLLGTL